MAIVRCWWRPCSGDVPLEQAVELDRHGTPVDWSKNVIWDEPAYYHPECAKQFQAAREASRRLNGVTVIPDPVGAIIFRSLPREEAPARPKKEKPKQLSMLDFLDAHKPKGE